MIDLDDVQKGRAIDWFESLRDRLVAVFEAIEDEGAGGRPAGRFERKRWDREGGGGGTMALMRGQVLEKAGVNVSTVEGVFSEELRGKMPGAAEDPRFWASGISVVVHPHSPLVPAAHMNTRLIATSNSWFGGGADMTPVYPDQTDTDSFHAALRAICDAHAVAEYPRYKAWCDEYFYLPHRNEARGIGGIFFDNLNSGDWDADFDFVQDVGRAFHQVYPAIVRRHMNEPWSDEQKRDQREKRGRYVEFNLLYDRGTLFGLKTGGNIEAIFMSLPPDVAWP